MINELSLKCLQNVIQVKLNKNYLDKITSKTGHYSSTPNIFSYGKKLFLGTVWGKTLVNGEHLQHARQVWDLRATGIYTIFQKKKERKLLIAILLFTLTLRITVLHITRKTLKYVCGVVILRSFEAVQLEL